MASEGGPLEGAALDVRVSLSRPSGRQSFQLDAAFQLPPGITILFGPSGAGKSTMLDCIAGLLHPAAGRISLGDTVLQDSATSVFLPPRKRQLAYLFQSPALFPHLTVKQNAEFGL